MKSKLVIIQGSPRKKGNTAFICEYIRNRLSASFEITLINLCDYNIKYCIGCRKCMKDGKCGIKDDFGLIWDIVLKSDVIIQASPVYWYAPPGIMKNFIDRTHSSYLAGNQLKGKTGGVVTIATEEGFECAEKILSCWMEQYGAKLVAKLRIKGCEAGEVKKNHKSMELLSNFCNNMSY